MTRRQLLAGSAALGSVFAAAGLTGCGGTAAHRRTGHCVLASPFRRRRNQDAGNDQTGERRQPLPAVHPTVLAWGPPITPSWPQRPPEAVRRNWPSCIASRVPGYAPGFHRPVGHVPAGRARGERGELRTADLGQEPARRPVFSIALDSHPFVMFYNTDVAGQSRPAPTDSCRT